MNYLKLIVFGLLILFATTSFADDCKCGCLVGACQNDESELEKRLYTIQEKIVDELKKHSDELEKIQTLEKDIIGKWQYLLEVLLPIQLAVIKEYGYEATQEGLSKFHREYEKFSDRLEQFKNLNQEKWGHILEKSFGYIENKRIPMEQFDAIVNEICETVTSEEFLESVKERLESLPVESTLVEKRQALLELLFKAKLKVLYKFDLEGDEGYVQYSKAMIEHFNNSSFKKKTLEAFDELMKSAGLKK